MQWEPKWRKNGSRRRILIQVHSSIALYHLVRQFTRFTVAIISASSPLNSGQRFIEAFKKSLQRSNFYLYFFYFLDSMIFKQVRQVLNVTLSISVSPEQRFLWNFILLICDSVKKVFWLNYNLILYSGKNHNICQESTSEQQQHQKKI